MSSYTAGTSRVDGIEVVRLIDRDREMQVSVAPSIGNIAYEFLVRDRNMLWFPFRGPAELRADPKLCGIPFLAPWANRIDGEAYWVDGRKYTLNPAIGNLRRDANQRPIHGLLLFSPLWQVLDVKADGESACVSSRLEFWKHPELMAQFPFAHEITMMHRLAGDGLEIAVSLKNFSADAMPVAIGFHPYFQLPDTPRDGWTAHIAARQHVLLDEFLIPTGQSKPLEFADPCPLDACQLDDAFIDLIRDSDGIARFRAEAGDERLTVEYGPKFRVAVIYAPKGRDYICFEPMAALTNAFNLAHQGKDAALESVASGAEWHERFRVCVGSGR